MGSDSSFDDKSTVISVIIDFFAIYRVRKREKIQRVIRSCWFLCVVLFIVIVICYNNNIILFFIVFVILYLLLLYIAFICEF